MSQPCCDSCGVTGLPLFRDPTASVLCVDAVSCDARVADRDLKPENVIDDRARESEADAAIRALVAPGKHGPPLWARFDEAGLVTCDGSSVGCDGLHPAQLGWVQVVDEHGRSR